MTVSSRGTIARLGSSGERRERSGSGRPTDPHLVLAMAAVVVLLAEFLSVETSSAVWILLAAAASFVSFVIAWREQGRIRLLPLLALALAFNVAWIALHLRLGVESLDSSVLYRSWGNALLEGHYPESQYPPGAVLLFALDALLGGGPTRTAHAFVMVPFQLATVAAVWAFRTRWTPWFAALAALWPMNAFSWEFRFDLAPTALLALGLLFAFRERWALSGALLGLGAAVKWTPGLAAAALVIWLVSDRRWRQAGALAGASAFVFVALHLPFLVWSPTEATYAYRYFSGQGLTGESLWYLLLSPFGGASVPLREFWLPATVPGWANAATIAVQALVLLAVGVAAWSARANRRAGVALAATAPVFFLLLNHVFSPQYLILIAAAWLIAGALLVERRNEQLTIGVAVMAATTANALVYPYTLHQHGLWRLASATLFAVGLATTAWLVWRSLSLASQRGEATSLDTRPLATSGAP
jgi:uncharacterized membrane protein